MAWGSFHPKISNASGTCKTKSTVRLPLLPSPSLVGSPLLGQGDWALTSPVPDPVPLSSLDLIVVRITTIYR
ncbi:MAG: hypothetical protein IPI18_17545 [Saprospiraceae bacterium]|nr:hypothetical protein [Saprospiraceae bacterium]